MNTKPKGGQTTVSPSFDNPPVVETAMSIQFDELTGFKAIHFGLFHERIAEHYPISEDHPRLQPIEELFPKAPAMSGFQFHAGVRPQRVWFKDTEFGSQLVQLQPDRFTFNWRRPDNDVPYPRYTQNSQQCFREFYAFVEFCRQTPELGEIRPNMCEVAYVNHIWPTPESNETAIALFARMFSGITWEHSDECLPNPEVAVLNRTYVIGEERGRLYAEASIVHKKERGSFILLKMVGRVLRNEGENIEDSVQLAHDWVVNGFVSLTDTAIRRDRWRQTQ